MKKVEVIYERFTKDGREVVGSGADKDWLDSNELINTEALTKQVGGDHMKPHKWAKEIKAWADGAEIEQKIGETWHQVLTPGWVRDTEYRIKPQPKESQYLYVWKDGQHNITFTLNPPHPAQNIYNLKVIGKIKLEAEND